MAESYSRVYGLNKRTMKYHSIKIDLLSSAYANSLQYFMTIGKLF